MNSKFTIGQISTTFSGRPPISSKVREYFECFLSEQLLKKKDIIVNSKWNVHLRLTFMQEGARYKSDYLFLGKSATTLSCEMLKIYEILIPLKLLNDVDDKYKKILELIYEALTIFFTANYKSVKPLDMEELWKIVDFKYLLSLPYPASLVNQKYATDMINEKGEIVD